MQHWQVSLAEAEQGPPDEALPKDEVPATSSEPSSLPTTQPPEVRVTYGFIVSFAPFPFSPSSSLLLRNFAGTFIINNVCTKDVRVIVQK